MPERLEYVGRWACEKCGQVIEETDPDLLEARVQLHHCEKEKKVGRTGNPRKRT